MPVRASGFARLLSPSTCCCCFRHPTDAHTSCSCARASGWKQACAPPARLTTPSAVSLTGHVSPAPDELYSPPTVRQIMSALNERPAPNDSPPEQVPIPLRRPPGTWRAREKPATSNGLLTLRSLIAVISLILLSLLAFNAAGYAQPSDSLMPGAGSGASAAAADGAKARRRGLGRSPAASILLSTSPSERPTILQRTTAPQRDTPHERPTPLQRLRTLAGRASSAAVDVATRRWWPAVLGLRVAWAGFTWACPHAAQVSTATSYILFPVCCCLLLLAFNILVPTPCDDVAGGEPFGELHSHARAPTLR